MEKVLVSWIGGNDLKVVSKNTDESVNFGPVLSTLLAQQFDRVYLIYNYPKKQVSEYLKWLGEKIETPFEADYVKLSSPTDYADIYSVSENQLSKVWSQHVNPQLNILLSPGTPAMQAVWVLLGKTKYPASFIQSSLEQGVQNIEIPFDISAEFLPSYLDKSDKQLTNIIDAKPATNAAFDDIVTQNPQMKVLKGQASFMAARNIPVLIYGDTGTGKELFATAIHNASSRKKMPFVTVNCGAIPAELIDSVLFGHKKGAFTGAISDKPGYFEVADNGTLFLDEFGELPAEAQIRLLRVLQDGTFTPVGSTKEIKVDVRVVAATNRNLLEAVVAGDFREDLFYRIAVGVLNLPPLRERTGDIGLLADMLLEKINAEAASQPSYKQKKFSIKAKKFLLNQQWRGNIRELYSTLLRSSLWSSSDEITEKELSTACFDMPNTSSSVLEQQLGNGFDIQQVISNVARHYIDKANKESAGNKTKAAKLLGLSNYQTLKNWEEKHK